MLTQYSLQTTPNYGQGANLAYESVAHLTNLLHPLLQKNPNPTLYEIKDLFETIDRKHRQRAKEVVKVARLNPAGSPR